MKNFHWGKAITLFFVLYILLLIWVVFKSRTIDHSLVKEDYYAHDIAYQKYYNTSTNQLRDFPEIDVVFDAEKKLVVIDFGKVGDTMNGSIHLYRASNKSIDRHLDFSKEAGAKIVNIPADNLLSGKWQAQLEWSASNVSYSFKEILFVTYP